MVSRSSKARFPIGKITVYVTASAIAGFMAHLLSQNLDPSTNAFEGIRVLVSITGAWGFPEYSTVERFWMLRRQLTSYATLCEMGHYVEVFLTTYDNVNLDILNNLDCLCSRTGASVPLYLHTVKMEPLPNSTFGTRGTLAFQHRKLFAKHSERFDIFVTQEDDTLVLPKNILYFHQWTSKFKGTLYHPAFLFYEVGKAKTFTTQTAEWVLPSFLVDFRIRDIFIVRSKEGVLVSTKYIQPLLYMISKYDLNKYVSDPGWQDLMSQNVTDIGEFNPYFGTPKWMSHQKQVVIPMSSIQASLVHHSSNKLVKTQKSESKVTDFGTMPELRNVIKSLNNFISLKSQRDCLDRYQAIHLSAPSDFKDLSRWKCMPVVDVPWSGRTV